MMSWFYATAICAAVFAYWVFCRNNALKHQEEAADLLEKYLTDESISEREKSKMYFNYRLFRFWFALPLVFILAPFFIVYAFMSKKFIPEDMSKENSKEFQSVFDVLMKMYIAKNPIVSTISLSFFGVLYAALSVIGTVLNNASKMPSASALASSITGKLMRLKQRLAH